MTPSFSYSLASRPPLQMSGYRPLVPPATFAALAAAAAIHSRAVQSSARGSEFHRPPANAANQETQGSGKFLAGRSKGMWAFDTLLYPLLTNAAVFALSVFATYATTYGKPGNLMRVRGDWARRQMEKRFRLSPKTAKETIMIAFSFLDGCLMAPVIKFCEDRKMKVAKWFDSLMGTTPEDKSVYEKEPRQSWLSVLAGRATALALVLPTAKLLSRKINASSLKRILPESGFRRFLLRKFNGEHSINEVMFNQPGQKMGDWLLQKWPALGRPFSLPSLGNRIKRLLHKRWAHLPKNTLHRINIPGLAEICAFEAFYTGLCTLGLYLSSRFYARMRDHRA